MSIGHLHYWSFVNTDETKSAVAENKAVFFPEPGKIGRAGFGPFGVVIAGNDMARDFQSIENLFGETKLLARAIFGNVTRKDDEAQASNGIDVAHGSAQVFFASNRTDVCIAQPRESKSIGLSD